METVDGSDTAAVSIFTFGKTIKGKISFHNNWVHLIR